MPPDEKWTNEQGRGVRSHDEIVGIYELTHDELFAIYERRFAELDDVDETTTFVGRPVVPVSFEVADMSPWLREQRRARERAEGR